jgi:hypothetical protein
MTKVITEKQILMQNIHELQKNLQEAYIHIANLHENLEKCLAEKDREDAKEI